MGVISLSDETIDKLADRLVKKSDSFQKLESEKKLRNVKVLLINYKYLENHLNVELPRLEDDVKLSNYELSLYSLLGYRARSKELMTFVNTILSRYKQICEDAHDEGNRRYDVIYRLYIAPQQLTYAALSKKYSVDDNTIRRDERKAIKQLSVMMFGADSIDDMSK